MANLADTNFFRAVLMRYRQRLNWGKIAPTASVRTPPTQTLDTNLPTQTLQHKRGAFFPIFFWRGVFGIRTRKNPPTPEGVRGQSRYELCASVGRVTPDRIRERYRVGVL